MQLAVSKFAQVSLRIAIVLSIAAVAVIAAPPRLAWSVPETRITQALDANDGKTVDIDFPASHVVVQWDGDESAFISLRSASKGGAWSDWQTVSSGETTEEATSEEGSQTKKANERLASSPIRVERAVKFQVKVDTKSQASNLSVVAIDTEYGPRHLEAVSNEPKAAAIDGATPQPQVISRKQWGANESIRKGAPEFAPVKRVVVHHTDTSNNDPNPAATVRAIYTYHVQGNGWNDIGYNFLIDQNGNIYEGRYARNYNGANPTGEDENGRHVIGAHVGGANTGSVGISLLGSFQKSTPTNAQQAALERMIAWEGDRHNLDVSSSSVVMGHRDLGQSACPGDVAHSLLPKWRENANALKFSYAQPGNTPGYWIAGADGSVKAFGNATHYGSMAGHKLNAPIISMARTPSANGYWLLGADGGIFSFGDAEFFGSMGGKPLNKPVVALTPTPTGKGYWEVASDGGVFAFGDAEFFGSMGGKPLNKPVVGIAATPSGKGYWEVATDGGIFAFGDAPFYGSTGSIKLNQPIVSMTTPAAGNGYWLTARDGGIFAFGATGFFGSIPVLKLAAYAGTVQSAATATGRGYYVLGEDGGVYAFGDARFHGAATGSVKAAGIALMPE